MSAYPQVMPARRAGGSSQPPARSGARSERNTELGLGAVASLVLLLIAGMVWFVFKNAWPSFEHNGLAWFLPGGDANQQLDAIFRSPADPSHYVYHLRAWPLLWGTGLIAFGAVAIGLVFTVFASVFIVEFAPRRMSRVLQPAVRLLAAVPSVIYGLIGILVIVPFVGNNLITQSEKASVDRVIQLNGEGMIVGVLILTVMVTPIMIAIVSDALRNVPRGWTEGAAALGVNRWRVMWTISLRTVRPAIIAAAVLAMARALGEAIMLAMVTGSTIFAPNPIDGPIFFFEPTQPFAAAIVNHSDELSVPPLGETLYAFAAVLLISAMFLSIGGYLAKQPLKRYGMRV